MNRDLLAIGLICAAQISISAIAGWYYQDWELAITINYVWATLNILACPALILYEVRR